MENHFLTYGFGGFVILIVIGLAMMAFGMFDPEATPEQYAEADELVRQDPKAGALLREIIERSGLLRRSEFEDLKISVARSRTAASVGATTTNH